jgi:outer membrane protein assembly factor BamA
LWLLLLQVDLTVNLVERKTGGLGAGTGISAAGHGTGNMPGFVGNFTYRWREIAAALGNDGMCGAVGV